jgi:hypothetical protein
VRSFTLHCSTGPLQIWLEAERNIKILQQPAIPFTFRMTMSLPTKGTDLIILYLPISDYFRGLESG